MAARVKVVNPFDEPVLDDATAEAEELAQPAADATAPAQGAGETPAAGEEKPVSTPEGGSGTTLAPAPAEHMVPIGRLNEVINERNELREYRERWARLEERQKQVKEAREAAERAAQQQEQAAARPDPSIDPVGAQLFDALKEIGDLKTWKQAQEQQFAQLNQGIQQDRQAGEFNNWVMAQAQAYQREQPDYLEAAKFAAERRMDFWEELGLPRDAAEGQLSAKALVMAESNLLAQLSRQSGKSFAPVVYKLATGWGYQRAGVNGNGAPSPAAASSAGRVLSQVAKGQAMQGLSRAPASGSEAKSRYRDMSAADMANLSEREWSAAMANPVTKAELEYAMKKADGLLEDADVSYSRR